MANFGFGKRLPLELGLAEASIVPGGSGVRLNCRLRLYSSNLSAIAPLIPLGHFNPRFPDVRSFSAGLP